MPVSDPPTNDESEKGNLDPLIVEPDEGGGDSERYGNDGGCGWIPAERIHGVRVKLSTERRIGDKPR